MNLQTYWQEAQPEWIEIVKPTLLELATIEWQENPPVMQVCRPGYCDNEFISYWISSGYQRFCCAKCEIESDELAEAEAYFDMQSELRHEFYMNAHEFGMQVSHSTVEAMVREQLSKHFPRE